MKSFVSTDPNSHESENIWFTPPEIVKPLEDFDLDVCSVSYRPFDIARKHIEHDRGECAFDVSWDNKRVWMNPPYGKQIKPFIERFSTIENGIALVFARMGTPWMQDWIRSGGGVFFLRKRVRFIDKKGVRGTNAGTDSCFLYSGKGNEKIILESGLDGVLLEENRYKA